MCLSTCPHTLVYLQTHTPEMGTKKLLYFSENKSANSPHRSPLNHFPQVAQEKLRPKEAARGLGPSKISHWLRQKPGVLSPAS